VAERDYSRHEDGADALAYFTTSRAELERPFEKLKRTLSPADRIWRALQKLAIASREDAAA
jgi:hypothetical protein